MREMKIAGREEFRVAGCGFRVKNCLVFNSKPATRNPKLFPTRNPHSAISLIISLLLCALPAIAQDAARADARGRFDLTGTWALDKSKSDFGPFEDSPVVKADVTLAVAHAGPELKISRRESRDGREQTTELVYYTDGRGELNPSTLGRVGVKSETKWDGNKIVATSTLTRRGADGKPATLETTDKWQLSKDGRLLTQTTAVSFGGGTQTIKQVYRRVG